MHYQITEAEFIRLQSCEKQLRLISDLCSHAMGSREISLDGLMNFLNAQEEALATTLAAVEGRFVAEPTPRMPAELPAMRPRTNAPARKRERLTAGAA